MTKIKNIKIIYIVGPPKSGTTLLQRIISSSIKGNKFIIPECHSLTSTLKEFHEIITYNDNYYINGQFGSKKKMILYFKNIINQKVEHLIQTNKKNINKKIIVLKDPNISYYLKSLNLLVSKNSYLVLILRNPLFVIDRYIKGTKREYNSYNFLEIVKKIFLFYYEIENFMKLNKNYYLIRYEDLINKNFNKLGKFLSIKLSGQNYLKVRKPYLRKKTFGYSEGFTKDIDKKYNSQLHYIGFFRKFYIINRFGYFIDKYYPKLISRKI